MIVVDTNMIGYLLLDSDRSDQAEAALRRDSHWISPILWRSEFRNVLALYIRQGPLSLGNAIQIISAAEDLMSGNEYEVASARILELVDRSTCSAYDCEFVALDQDLDIPLVTVDKQLLAQFPETAESLDAFVS